MSKGKKVVLVVDDESDVRFVIKELLNNHGYEVEEAEDGQIAVRKLLTKQFDLIILDLIMPKLDGFGVIDELRNRKISTPVVMLTIKEDFHSFCTASIKGITEYVCKPFKAKLLIDIVNQLTIATREN